MPRRKKMEQLTTRQKETTSPCWDRRWSNSPRDRGKQHRHACSLTRWRCERDTAPESTGTQIEEEHREKTSFSTTTHKTGRFSGNQSTHKGEETAWFSPRESKVCILQRSKKQKKTQMSRIVGNLSEDLYEQTVGGGGGEIEGERRGSKRQKERGGKFVLP